MMIAIGTDPREWTCPFVSSSHSMYVQERQRDRHVERRRQRERTGCPVFVWCTTSIHTAEMQDAHANRLAPPEKQNHETTRSPPIRSRPGKPNQRKCQNEKFMNFAHFCEFWRFSLEKQARFTLNFCSGMPLRKVHELTFFLVWFAGATPEPTPVLKDIPFPKFSGVQNVGALAGLRHIYICCEVIIWAKFGGFQSYYLGQVNVIIWAKLVFTL